MAQDAGAASCALFVEQAEAAVADSTVTTHAARASRRVPGMRRARNMAGPALRRVSSTCYEAVQEFPFEIHKSLPSNGLRISSLIKVVSLLARTYGKKRRILGQPPRAVLDSRCGNPALELQDRTAGGSRRAARFCLMGRRTLPHSGCHLSTGVFAALTSSSRLTGVVCGAL